MVISYRMYCAYAGRKLYTALILSLRQCLQFGIYIFMVQYTAIILTLVVNIFSFTKIKEEKRKRLIFETARSF